MHAFIPSSMRECIHEDKMLDLGMVSELGLEDWKGGPQIHHRNLTDLTAMKFSKITSQPSCRLGFQTISRDPQILLFSVVSDVLLFLHHSVYKADQTFQNGRIL